MRASRALLAIAAAVVVGWLSPLARAGDSIKVGEVVAHGWSPWPKGLKKGQYPIFVELRNESDHESVIVLNARGTDWSETREVHRSVALRSGESTRIELLAPLSANWNDWGVSVDVDRGDSEGYINDVGGGNYNVHCYGVLVISANPAEVGAIERWTADVSTEALNTRTVYSASGASTATAPNDNIQFGAARFDELASMHAGYSSLDLAVLDTRAGMPSEEQLTPLIDWVQLGGELLLIGPNAEALARQTPALAAWLEPRFLGASHMHPSCYACGMGRLWFDASEEALFNTSQRDLIRAIVVHQSAMVPDPAGSRVFSASPTIPGLGQVPHRVFGALLILFALVIGPINFIAVKRWKKPVLLLLTIPAIALVSSLLLLSYGIFVQGLDVKTASCSVSVLDQREHRSVCVEKRLMFAGLSPADGLRPGPGTAVYAISGGVPDFTPIRSLGARERLTLRVDQDQGRTLSADYLPTRVPVLQVLHCEQASRGRLDVRAEGEGFAVENGLGVDVKELVLRDMRGRYFSNSTDIAAGAKVSLRPVDDMNGERASLALLRDPIRARFDPRGGDEDSLPVGCYAATIASGVFRDGCGIETNELFSQHRVLGVLAADDGAWQ